MRFTSHRVDKLDFGGSMIGLVNAASKKQSFWQMSDWMLKLCTRSLAFLEGKPSRR